LAGVGIAQHADALAIDDLVGLRRSPKASEKEPVASAGMSSIRTTG
jgi:hypothetical protein